MTALIGQMARFGAVGVMGILVDFSVTWICKERLKINKFIANAAGFAVAVVNNYLLNRMWTFKSDSPDIGRQFLFFFLISIVGLALNTAILYLLHQKKQLGFYPAKIAAIAVVFLWNFTANSLLTFRHG